LRGERAQQGFHDFRRAVEEKVEDDGLVSRPRGEESEDQADLEGGEG
jgi:hypothetical protein